MKHVIVGVLGLILATGVLCNEALAQTSWPQWGQNSQHQGFVTSIGQDATSVLADVIYDPFTAAEERDTGGDLLVHYQVPLVDGDDVFMEFKTGRFIECSPPGSGNPPPGETDCGQSAWNSQIWNQKRLHWEAGNLVEKWTFQSDWKAVRVELAQWEPVYHAVLVNDFVYDPGFGGTVFKLARGSGTVVSRINPFGNTLDPNTFVAGPLSADSSGNVYYNAIKFTDQTLGAFPGLVNSWLVKVAPDDTVSMVSYPTLLSPLNPPTGVACERSFRVSQLPWPPSPTAPTRLGLCGAQRPGLNIAPAIGADGTIYTASRGHFPAGDRQAYVVAVNPNLTLKWAMSLKNTLNDGCGALVPIAAVDMPATPPWDLATFKGKCRHGANFGVDPSTNQRGSGRVLDSGTSSPVVLPDGNIYFGAYSRYNIARGHAFKLRGSDGAILATYDFGWDDTQAVFQHGGTYSIVMKDNHYDEEAGFYCNSLDAFGNQLPTVSQGGDPTILSNVVCDFTTIPAGPFFITQVNPNLAPEWKFKSTETRDCHRNPDGSVTCVDDGRHPNGFEWCINAPAVDGAGNVYVESEDGNVYVLDQGHGGIFTTPKFKLFTNLAVGAAYTPFSIDMQGRLHAQNNGHLFVLGTGGQGVQQRDEGRGPHTQKRHPETDRD
jgi:outer membrane protein assembly factor BamB